jgi:hypothetical protein
MFRSLGLLVILAGVAGYFTKPTEAAHREAARAALEQLQQDALANLASRYTVEVNQRPVADCWGAFTQVRCTPAAADMAAAAKGG